MSVDLEAVEARAAAAAEAHTRHSDGCWACNSKDTWVTCAEGDRLWALRYRASDVPELVAEVRELRAELLRTSERLSRLTANQCRLCGGMHDDAYQPPPPAGACAGGGQLGSRWMCPSCRDAWQLREDNSLLRASMGRMSREAERLTAALAAATS